MSLKNPKHLLIIGAVAVALMVGTVLLGSYANILPGSSDTETCQAKNSTPCSAANPVFAETAKVECAQKAEAGFVAKACPVGSTEPCCAGEATTSCCPAQNSPGQSDEGCCPPKCCPDDCENCCCPEKCCPNKCGKCSCPKLCPPDCTKPCCAGEAAPSGCPMAGMSAATNSGCCPKTNTATE